MNNIEILEELIKYWKDLYKISEESSPIYNWIKDEKIEEKTLALENLIKENKELKNKCNELNFKYTAQWVDDNFIPKSKVKEKIEVIQKRMKEETRTDFLIMLKILENELQELLEEGE